MGLWLFFGIHFSCDVTGDAVVDTLAFDTCRYSQLLLVLIDVLRKVLPLPGKK